MNNKPLISIYIITHNRVELLKRCVKSVRNQSYKNIEILIVDDNSRDDTWSYLEQVAGEDFRLKIFRNELNRGACFSRNLAIKHSTGEYITGVDDDDYFLTDRIDDFYRNINLLDKYIMIFTDSIWKDLGKTKPALLNKFLKREVNYNDLIIFNYIGNQVFTKSEVLKKNKFNVDMPAWQDLECWMSILKNTGKNAYKIKKYNYVQDISHPHERISNKKISKIYDAYELITKKFSMSKYDKMVLESHLYMYGGKQSNLIMALFLSLKYTGIMGLFLFLRNMRFLIRK